MGWPGWGGGSRKGGLTGPSEKIKVDPKIVYPTSATTEQTESTDFISTDFDRLLFDRLRQTFIRQTSTDFNLIRQTFIRQTSTEFNSIDFGTAMDSATSDFQ